MFIIVEEIWRLTVVVCADDFGLEAATCARYCITFFVFSVFPAPDSPVHKIDWSSRSIKVKRGVWINKWLYNGYADNDWEVYHTYVVWYKMKSEYASICDGVTFRGQGYLSLFFTFCACKNRTCHAWMIVLNNKSIFLCLGIYVFSSRR